MFKKTKDYGTVGTQDLVLRAACALCRSFRQKGTVTVPGCAAPERQRKARATRTRDT